MSEYLCYRLLNMEPVRVNNSPVRQSGQNDTMDYIHGAAIRGLVINALAKDPDFPEIKNILFSDRVAFLDAYVRTKDHLLYPSPRGFYEDKVYTEGRKKIENVVIKGTFNEGTKRAGLGRYCYIDEECIHYYSVPTGAEMKILINTEENRKVFRGEYICTGQCFEGYIRLSGEEHVDTRIAAIFRPGKEIRIGNARSAGSGKCQVIHSERVYEIPYLKKGFDSRQEAYMMLLSDTVLRNGKGELCGLDFNDDTVKAEFESRLGVSELKIAQASTSVRTVAGYNRTWGAPLPSMTVYEAGSVFHLKYEGILLAGKMESLCDTGIGIRRNEGFGRVLFLKDYERVRWKQSEGITSGQEIIHKDSDVSELTVQQRQTLLTAARGYYRQQLEAASQSYILNHPLKRGGVSRSFIGTAEARLLKQQYNPEKARQDLSDFFDHVKEKETSRRVQSKKAVTDSFREQILRILDTPLEETLFYGREDKAAADVPFRRKGYVMGLPTKEFFTEEEEKRYKIKLAIRMIRFERKEERDDS